jgi:hypothetical protein
VLYLARHHKIWIRRFGGTVLARNHGMGDAEDLDLLRETYERALASYEAVCAALNRHLLAGTRPSPGDIQRERDARATLEAARRAYLDAWMQP